MPETDLLYRAQDHLPSQCPDKKCGEPDEQGSDCKPGIDGYHVIQKLGKGDIPELDIQSRTRADKANQKREYDLAVLVHVFPKGKGMIGFNTYGKALANGIDTNK
jgi:hypothetical protein